MVVPSTGMAEAGGAKLHSRAQGWSANTPRCLRLCLHPSFPSSCQIWSLKRLFLRGLLAEFGYVTSESPVRGGAIPVSGKMVGVFPSQSHSSETVLECYPDLSKAEGRACSPVICWNPGVSVCSPCGGSTSQVPGTVGGKAPPKASR